MFNANIKLEEYTMKSGKFKGMRVTDILKIVIVDKHGKDKKQD